MNRHKHIESKFMNKHKIDKVFYGIIKLVEIEFNGN